MATAIQDLTIKIVSPDDAKVYLQDNEYALQRGINSNTVKYYADMMRNGQWLPGSEIEIAYAPNGDGKVHGYLINGQHRMHAVIEADKTIVFVVKEVLCSDAAEMATRYGMIDTGRGRNAGDLVRAMGMESELGFTQAELNRIGPAVAFIGGDFANRGKYGFTPLERVEYIRQYADAAHAYIKCVRSAPMTNAALLLRASSMSVGLVTFDESARIYGDGKVADFWIGIAQNDGLRIGDPRKLAVQHLHESLKAGNNKKAYSAPYSARHMAHCFNAWVEDRQVTRTTVMDALGPIFIRGSKYRGK